MTADVKGSTDKPISLGLEAGYRPSQGWKLYGDAYWQPTQKVVGADLVARYKENLDLYAGGSVNYGTGVGQAEAGVRWRL